MRMSEEASPTSGVRTLSGVLRALGAACFVGAGASFLVEGWTDPGVLQRQLLWAAGTLLMTVFGVVAVRRYRDPLGARVCLGLAAATLPVHFAQLGAAVWSLRLEGIRVGPDVAVAGAAVLALGPALALGLSALVRRQARLLTGVLFIVSAPLLVPTRDGDLVAVLAALQLGVLVAVEGGAFRRDPLFRTVEGVAARVVLALPWVLMLSRNLYYPDTPIFRAALVGLPSLVALVLPAMWALPGAYRAPLQVFGTAGLALAVILAGPSGMLLAPLVSLVALLGAELVPGRAARYLGWCAAIALTFAAGMAWSDPSAWLALTMLPLGGLHVVSAYRRREGWQLMVVFGFTLIACAGHLSVLVRLPAERLWVPGALGSVALLALASAVERHRGNIERALGHLRMHLMNEEPTS